MSKILNILFIPFVLWLTLLSLFVFEAKAKQSSLEEFLASSFCHWQNPAGQTLAFEGNTLFAISNPPSSGAKVVKEIKVIATAYSSFPGETDSSPLITASGTEVRDGVVAANFLPFGTKIRLPALYGDKIFVVEDRMHPRKQYQVDIWFPSREEALNFGAETTYIEVLES